MKFYERITNLIFPDQHIFKNEYYRGQTIMNQPQLIGKTHFESLLIRSAIQALSVNWHEDILCLIGVNQEKLEDFVRGEGEFQINLLETAKFHGPKWTTLPGAYIRSKLGEINDEFKSEAIRLAEWAKHIHTHNEIGIFS